MEPSVTIFDMLFLAGLTAIAVMLLLGFFWDAPWLRARWGRGSEIPLSHLSRLIWLLITIDFGALCFASDFHYHKEEVTRFGLPALIVLFAIMILSSFRDSRIYKKSHDTAA